MIYVYGHFNFSQLSHLCSHIIFKKIIYTDKFEYALYTTLSMSHVSTLIILSLCSMRQFLTYKTIFKCNPLYITILYYTICIHTVNLHNIYSLLILSRVYEGKYISHPCITKFMIQSRYTRNKLR